MSDFNSLDSFNNVNYMYSNMENVDENKGNSDEELNRVINDNNSNGGSKFKLRPVTETEQVEEYDEMQAYAEMKRMENGVYTAKAEVIVEQFAEEERERKEREYMQRRARSMRGSFWI